MKYFLSALLLSLIGHFANAQSFAQPRSIQVHAGLWQASPAMSGSAYNTAGIRQEYRQSPLFFGIDYAGALGKRWQYFLSVQASRHEITGWTTLEPPQPLGTNVVRLQTVTYEQASWQWMAGGGAHYYLISKKEFALRLNAGLFGSYANSQTTRGRSINLPTSSGSDWSMGGEVQHEVYRSVIPVGRFGAGAHYRPRFAPRFTVGAELHYYRSPDFVRGNWTRNLPNTSTLATSGNYQGGLNNLVLSLQGSFSF
jgi:hypothetical protein